MSVALHVRQLLRTPLSKSISCQEKSDLALLWERSRSPVSSPEESPPENRTANILSLLSSAAPTAAHKKLYCPPMLDSRPASPPKETAREFAFSMVSLSSRSELTIPDHVLQSHVFAFKGNKDEQPGAWASFKSTVRTAQFAIMACVNCTFFIQNGVVTASGITQTAQKKLQDISEDLPHVDADRAIEFLDGKTETEKMLLYSTNIFNYGVVTPIVAKRAQMGSTNGVMHRVTLTGCIFEPVMKILADLNPGATLSTAMLKL
jgi:hypothetical protein